MAARGRSSSGTARLLVLVGILTVLGATFGVGVYTGRIWSARAGATTRFTVQIASYRVRPPAEALRESLASAGHDARVVEADANGPVYRVQVGDLPTREAARALAVRLSGERSSVTPFVTTR